MPKSMAVFLACLTAIATGPVAAAEAPLVVKIPRLSLEAAEKMAKATLAQCRKEGVQIAVTVMDRGGHPLVVMRDTLAPDLTLTISRQKAYTAMSFNAATSALENRFPGPHSVAKLEGLVMSAGGLPISAVGNIVGGIGVSGAPSGEQDERCAQAGLKAVSDELEMLTL